MEDNNCSAWVLCPSKKLPGRYYYFNTQTGEKAWSWTVPSGQTPDGRAAEKPKQRQTPDERISEKAKPRQTPDERISEKAKPLQTPDERISEKPQAQTSFSKVEFPRYLHSHPINPRKKGALKSNLNKPNGPVNNSNLTSQSRKSEHISFKSIVNNPFSLGLSELLKTDSKQLCKGIPTKKSVFEPIFDNNFLPRRRSSTDIEELGQAMKRAKICSPVSSISEQDNLKWNPNIVKIDLDFDDDTSSSTRRNRWHRNEDVKVGINFLRNLSTSEYTNTWYLVPDVEVLLENLNFIKEFIAGDRTCSLMTSAVVLAKLQSLRDDYRTSDDRAAIAGQVYLWLLENSVCETDNPSDCSLDNVTVHKQIIKYCIQSNTFHLVIITKSKSLFDLAKRNDIHVYYLNALKIINQMENLFLLDPDKATFKLPTSPAVLNECNSKKSAYKNLEIRVNQNGERSIFSRTSNESENSINLFNGNVKKNYVRTSTTIDIEGDFVESNLREFCMKHANLQTNVYKLLDECTCSFLQIMEYCLHNILQRIPKTQFDPPCWLHEGLQLLKEHYYQNKVLCAIVDRLISVCGFYIRNDIMRPNIKSDRFIQIFGAGILLIKELEKISQFPELSYCKEMLTDLIESIHTAEEFPEELSISSECRQRLGDEPFRMGREETADNSCDRFVSTKRTSRHEVITNTEPDYNIPLLRQNQHELFDIEGCCGSIKLFRNCMVDGNISKTNHTDSNQDKTIQSTGSNQDKTIQSPVFQLKTSQSTGSNQYKTIQSAGSNQDEIIQSIQCNQNKSDAILQQIQDTLIRSNVVSYESGSSSIQSVSILTNGISQTNDNGDGVFQKLETTVDMIRMALTKMKHFIERVMEELNKGGIPERRKEYLRENSDRFKNCVAVLFHTLKLIQKRENPNDPSFGKRFTIQNSAYTECIEHCLVQVEYMHRAFSYVLEALK